MTNSRTNKRIGILGGSFNPIHYGHLIAATEVVEQMGLDRIVFIPSARPPHKEHSDLESEAHRYIMTRMAIASQPIFEASRIEMNRPGLSYTVDTIRYLKHQDPESDFYFIMGADALALIGSWKDPEGIAELCAAIVAVSRPGSHSDFVPGDQLDVGPSFISKLRYLDIPGVDISSTDIRRRIREGRSISYLVPQEVESYIHNKRLYYE